MMPKARHKFALFCAITILLIGCKSTQSTTSPAPGGGGSPKLTIRRQARLPDLRLRTHSAVPSLSLVS